MKLASSGASVSGLIDVPARSAPMSAAPSSELTVIAAAAAGDPRAARRLVEMHQGMVYRLVWRMLARAAAAPRAEEVTQEAFVRIFGALPRFSPDGPAKFSTWILRIATRTAIDDLRRRRLCVAPLQGDHADPRRVGRPDVHAERVELAAAIAAAVDQLGPAPRAAFILRAYHGLTYPEIADALEIDVGTVKSRIHRARQVLQPALQELNNG